MNSLIPFVLTAITAIGCAGHLSSFGMSDDRGDTSAESEAVTSRWTEQVRRTARDGDWVLARTTSTGALTRAGIYDATRSSIIAATDGEIREIAIADELAQSFSVIVIRPAHMTAQDGADALARARLALLDPATDQAAMGPAAFLAWASQTAARAGAGVVAAPSDLVKFGEVVYMSGRRDTALADASDD